MKVVITVEVENNEEARLIAKGLQDEIVRMHAKIVGKLCEMDVDPSEYQSVFDTAMDIKFGKGRH